MSSQLTLEASVVKVVTLAEDSDFTIRVIGFTGRHNNTEHAPKVLELKVLKEIVSTNEFSPVLANMMQPRFENMELEDSKVLELRELNVDAIEITLRELHQKRDAQTLNVDIVTIWYILKNADQYGFKNKPLRDWFAEWYEANAPRYGCIETPIIDSDDEDDETEELSFFEALLYPAYVFDNPKAFMHATKRLVYFERSIMSFNPIHVPNLRLNARIIQALNAAKGRMNNIYSKGVIEPKLRLLDANCDCSPLTNFGYDQELHRRKIHPFDKLETPQINVVKLLHRLKVFKWEPQSKSCRICYQGYTNNAQYVYSKVLYYFGGLCLDCVHFSEDKSREEIRELEEQPSNWSGKCRVRHNEPTWYFSFLARDGERPKLRKLQKRQHNSS